MTVQFHRPRKRTCAVCGWDVLPEDVEACLSCGEPMHREHGTPDEHGYRCPGCAHEVGDAGSDEQMLGWLTGEVDGQR